MDNVILPKGDADEFCDIQDTDKPGVSILMNLLVEHGIKNVVISPGSRNTPLIIGAAARRKLRKHIVVDERCAAFVALGMALVSQKPVALICTSGTALLNYSPAIAEAYYHGIPLIVISADRPKEWIDQDDSQTIRQNDAMANFVKGSFELSDTDFNVSEGWFENRIINEALILAQNGKPGPVHINFRLSPPLQHKSVAKSEVGGRYLHRKIESFPMKLIPERNAIKGLARTLKDKNIMVVCGFMQPFHRLNRAMLKLSELPNVVIMAETISNLHLSPDAYAIDVALALDDKISQLEYPDIIISIGGALVSRKLKDYLRKITDKHHQIEHWGVGYQNTLVDPFRALDKIVECPADVFMRYLAGELGVLKKDNYSIPSSYKKHWTQRKLQGFKRIESIVADFPTTDAWAFSKIFPKIPKNTDLFLSNGTPIRFAQIFSRTIPHAEFCNRGVSGIEASGTTAAGAATVTQNNTILITGDISALYDSALFHTADSLHADLKVILIDNSGGGIFRYIPSTSDLEEREQYFCVNPQNHIADYAKSHGWKVISADISKVSSHIGPNFHEALEDFFETSGRALLEIKVNPIDSAELLKKLIPHT